ncbi:MAG: sugar phosphate isomerase/epimerase [Ruminococcus flavefaciens]|nr:sugar phosphate isomerase/epimerase [Ruminococcus flavefaciens]
MKLSISNIGWTSEYDSLVYSWMKAFGYSGLEIAPTRIFPENPYVKNEAARTWAQELNFIYGFNITSMQSIWYGRQEKIFGSSKERQILFEYTKQAIDFAEAIGCGNLVFGCPGNRSIPDDVDGSIGVAFFKEIGDYASAHNAVIAMEANPPIYNTNYINTTKEAFRLVEEVDSPGFRLNLDVGTMVENDEGVSILNGRIPLINHVHISEPGLKPIEQRYIHQELKDVLYGEGYQGYVSIEMGKTDDVEIIRDRMEYVRGIFG